MTKYSIHSVLLIYFAFSFATLGLWNKYNINTVTGDEPHYLVIAQGIIKYRSLEQTFPYKEEFKTREIHKGGLAPEAAQPSPQNTHAVLGPNGLFNVHNIGLPLLLTLPFAIGGVVGAKLFMIFCGAIAVVMAWKISGYFCDNKKIRFLSTTSLCIGLPLIPASNQIYPDILAGIISLIGLYWYFSLSKTRSSKMEIALAGAISFLPWLQVKFFAPCVLLVSAVVIKMWLESKDKKRIFRIVLIFFVSCGLLAAYNHYAFGRIFGPYQTGALEVSRTSFMVLLGLHYDQNQGFLLQNPINLLGLAAIGMLYRCHKDFALVWGLVFLSLIVPNSMHPNWYGGGSFSGRFGWAAAIVFFLPALYGLIRLAGVRIKIFYVVVGAGLLLQTYFFYCYALQGVSLYNKVPSSTLVHGYSLYYSAVSFWFPMLYDEAWAYDYPPNYAWLAFILMLFILGFLPARQIKKAIPYVGVGFIIITLVAGFAGRSLFENSDNFLINGNDLPSQIGHVNGKSIEVDDDAAARPAGFLSYGPYVHLPSGNYIATVKYTSSADYAAFIGWIDVTSEQGRNGVAKIPVRGTAGVPSYIDIPFRLQQRAGGVEVRFWYDGPGSASLHGLEIRVRPERK